MPSLIRRVSLPPSINQENQKPKTFHSELFHCQNNSRTFNISMSNPSFYHPFPLPLLLIQMLVLPAAFYIRSSQYTLLLPSHSVPYNPLVNVSPKEFAK
ncbi:hypothetical protein ES332_A10G121600v1 [Gossypium tomentosum]|uniref:Uncharacterized protein n=1 Tax=Gossypium tomentosum TaxID=34277 RepID=A0A5D2NUC3_GOSTO|nr:hypothetical protein ES332_A10G121600v1 [Gossypium tomentosum]